MKNEIVTPKEATREEIRVALESAFFLFDCLDANDTKRSLLEILNMLGNPMQWDPKKGIDAPSPMHTRAQITGELCKCFECERLCYRCAAPLPPHCPENDERDYVSPDLCPTCQREGAEP